MKDSGLKEVVENFKQKRREQDNDLFYYINTMVEVDNILYELQNSLEDARNSHQDEEMKRIEAELSDWNHDYEEYIEECKKVLQDMHLNELSSYEEVERAQNSKEWEEIKFLLANLTRYHDLLFTVSSKEISAEMYEQILKIADRINSSYATIFHKKELDEYNVQLFGTSTKLIENVNVSKPTIPDEEDESLFEEIPESVLSDDVSLDEAMNLHEDASHRQKIEEPFSQSLVWPSFLPKENSDVKRSQWPELSTDLEELQRREKERKEEEERRQSIQDLISNTLPHIIEEKQEDWKIYLQDVSHHEMAKQLVTIMEKLEKGYRIDQFNEDVENYENGQDILYGVRKYSKEYQRQEEERLHAFDEKLNAPFTPEVHDRFVRPSFLPREEFHGEVKQWPVLNSQSVQRGSKEIVSDLFYYIHLYDVQNSKKCDLSRIIGLMQIDMEDLSSLDFNKKFDGLESEQIMEKIRTLVEEYELVTQRQVQKEKLLNIIQGLDKDDRQSIHHRVFSWVRKSKEKLSGLIQSKKKVFYTIALAGLALGTIASGKAMKRNSSVQPKVTLEQEATVPLVLEHKDVPVIEVVSELPEQEEINVEEQRNLDSRIHVGDSVSFKEDALIYRSEYLNTNYGGDKQGRIPSYSRDWVRQVEGIGVRMPDGTVKMVYEDILLQQCINDGCIVFSLKTVDGYYFVDDAIVVDIQKKGMSR